MAGSMSTKRRRRRRRSGRSWRWPRTTAARWRPRRPGRGRRRPRRAWRAAVPLAKATAWRGPDVGRPAPSSNSSTCGPWVSQSPLSTADDGGDVVVVDRLAPVGDHGRSGSRARPARATGRWCRSRRRSRRRAACPSIHCGLLRPPRVLGEDDVDVAGVDGVAALVGGEQHLVQLLAGPDADDLAGHARAPWPRPGRRPASTGSWG